MALSFELYWSFRSPYSYLALPRVVALVRDFAVEVEMRMVHPAAIRNPAYFRTMNPLARPYFMMALIASFVGIGYSSGSATRGRYGPDGVRGLAWRDCGPDRATTAPGVASAGPLRGCRER